MIKTPDDDLVDFKIKSMDTPFLEAIKKLEYPPIENDRMYMKIRLFSYKSAVVSNVIIKQVTRYINNKRNILEN